MTEGKAHGTGLGLWIARTLIEEQFSGTLSVTTTGGVGSCFTLTLPLTVEEVRRPELSAA